MRIYLDNAATTAIDEEVLQEMVNVMQQDYGNPSSIHADGRKVRTLIEKARKQVASLIGASPSEIFFTSGGTEADNMAIRRGITDQGLSHAITSPLEHHAVLHTLQDLEKDGIIQLSYVSVDEKGEVNLDHLKELLALNSRSFVSLMHANNELGTLINLEEISEICSSHDAVLHSDTVQTIGHLPIDVSSLTIDFITGAAHKFHGPKGVGFLYINHRLKIKPFIYGGAQERNMRGGTENVYGIVGLAKALEIACRDMRDHRSHVQGLKEYMRERLIQELPSVNFNGQQEAEKSLYTVLNVSFPETEMSDMLLFNLDIAGISASGGSACSSGSNIGSHVLSAIGASSERPSVRFSFSKFNTKSEVDQTVAKLKEFYTVSV